MTTNDKQHRTNWFVFGLIMGPVLGLITGEGLCIPGAIVFGIIAEGLRPKSHVSDQDTHVGKDAA